MRCLACGAPIPVGGSACPSCTAPVYLTHARQLVGLSYTLNRLDELAADGTLEPAGAARARARLAAELDALRRAAAPAVSARPGPARPSAAATAADRVLT